MIDAGFDTSATWIMDVMSWLARWHQLIVGWWRSLGLVGQEYVWLAAGAVCLSIWAWVSYRVLRHLAGYRKFGGRWYNRAEYERLIQVLWEDQQAGLRVMSHAELQAIRHYKYGASVKPLLSGKGGGGYFDG